MVNSVTATHDYSVPARATRRGAYRRRMLGLIATSYAIDTITLYLYFLAGATTPFIPVTYGVPGLTHCVAFFALSEIRLNDKFRDHYLTVPSHLTSTTIQVTCLALAPEVGFVFLSVLFIIFGFASLRLSARQATIAWGSAACGLIVIFLTTDQPVIIPTANYFARAVTLLFFSVTLGRCVLLGLYGSSLRGRLYLRSMQLREASQKIAELARIDVLTGILNRCSIMTELEGSNYPFATQQRFVFDRPSGSRSI